MAEASEISVELSHEFAITACRAGWEPRDFTLLAQSEDKLRQMLAFVRGQAETKPVVHVIDCDTAPYIPDGWEVRAKDQLSGAVGGLFVWDRKKAALYIAPKQKRDAVSFTDLKEELKGRLVFKANVLDFLIEHPELIPEDWKKGKYIFFWGTIYRSRAGSLHVRCLDWDGGRWRWGFDWLGFYWDSDYPAAVPAS